ncbi:MAG: nuclear transport factor 2 family protein [Pseudomonadota bacterium]
MNTLADSIRTYLAVSGGADDAALDECFRSDAQVSDEKQVHQGMGAIRAWLRAARARYQYSVVPLRSTSHGTNVSVIARIEGNFPGSPVELTHVFVLDDDGMIAQLKIG